jgi:hypothetical protein
MPQALTRRLISATAIAILVALAPRASAELTDKNVHLPPPAPPLPAAGQTFVDPTFGSTILRLTGPADGNDNKNAYAYWPTFNRSSTKLFVDTNNGATKLYDFDPRTMQASNKRDLFARRAPDGFTPGWEDAIWSGTDPNVIYGHTNLNVWAYNVQSTQYTLVKNFGSELPPGNLRQMSKSIDDQVFGFTTQDTNYNNTGSIAWRRNTNQVLLSLGDPANTNEIQVDKTGRYVMVSHEAQGANAIQTTIWDTQTHTSTDLTDGAPDYAPGHGDLGHGTSVAYENWNNRLLGRSLATPHQFTTVLQLPDFSQSQHLSMLADDESWGLLSNFYTNNGNTSTGLYKDEILLVATDGSQNVRRLAHHHSNYAGEYWNSPRADLSFDGRWVTFTSNWGDLSRRDVFVLRIGGPPPPAWNIGTSGSWHVGSNWTGGVVPNGTDAQAELGAIITANRTVFADTPVTLGTLIFNDDNTYNLGGSASLTMQVSSGSALLDVRAGTHKLNLPLTIASNTNLSVATGTQLFISDPVTVAAGKSFTHSGTGTITYQSTVTLGSGASIAFASPANVQSLNLPVDAKAQVESSLTISGGDYDATRSRVAQGFNGGDWRGNGITSASAAADPKHASGLGVADDSAGVLVKYTYYGDSDLSGTVNLEDFTQFRSGFDHTATAEWGSGDFNYSGGVDVHDFDLFLAGLRGQGYVSSDLFDALRTFTSDNGIDVDLTTAVPEPIALHIVALGAAGVAVRRRRK